MRRALGILVVSWLLLMPAVAWTGETSTATAAFADDIVDGAISAETRSLGEQIVNHLSAPNTDHFDFESGLDGWTLSGSAQRVQTQVLGGQWAVFGDGLAEGGASISLTLDLTDVDVIMMDVFYPGEPEFPIPTLTASFERADGSAEVAFIDPARVDDQALTQLIFDVPSDDDVELTFVWGPTPETIIECFPGPCPPPEPDSRLAFIDNITLVPIPEPATIVMLALGMAALVVRRRRSFVVIAGFAITVSIQAAHAAQSVPVTLTVEPELWLLNGNPAGQPLVPMLQQVDAPSRGFTENLTLAPTRTAVTGATIPASLAGGGTAAYSRTRGGSAILFPNVSNRFDPFTALIEVTARNRPGRAVRSQARWRAEIPVDLGIRLAFDRPEGAGATFFTAEFDLPGALGDPSAGTVMFTRNIALLSIPIEGTAHPHRFTSDEVTIMRTLGMNCRLRPPPGLPSDCETATFTAAGSVASDRLTLVTPVVIDLFSGEGADRTPTIVLGFVKVSAEGDGVRLVPEPNAVVMVALGLAGVGALSRRG